MRLRAPAVAAAVALAVGLAPRPAAAREATLGLQAGLLASPDSRGSGPRTSFGAGAHGDVRLLRAGRLTLRAEVATLSSGWSGRTNAVSVSTGVHGLSPAVAGAVRVGKIEPFVSLGTVAWLTVVSTEVDGATSRVWDLSADAVAGIGARGAHGPLVVRMFAGGWRRNGRASWFVGLSAGWRLSREAPNR